MKWFWRIVFITVIVSWLVMMVVSIAIGRWDVIISFFVIAGILAALDFGPEWASRSYDRIRPPVCDEPMPELTESEAKSMENLDQLMEKFNGTRPMRRQIRVWWWED